MRRHIRLLLFRAAFFLTLASKVYGEEPEFAEPIHNKTVVAGRDASLACVVSNLGTYKVAWIHYDRSAILAVHQNVITRNPRISVSYNNHRRWILIIKEARETDKGSYMCQINTEPIKTQIGYLTIVVPPNIIDSESSSEVSTTEDSNVTLRCRAKGNPTPNITWRREDDEKIRLFKNKEVATAHGEVLHINRVSRTNTGAYLCIASNGIPPAVSKRIVLKVDFLPQLTISHQLVGAPLGYDAHLECHIEANPKTIKYWTTQNNSMINVGGKYDVKYYEKGYSLDMLLQIKNLSKLDYGIYKCTVKNQLGETEGQISLYETEVPTTIPMSSTPHLPGKVDVLRYMQSRNKTDENLTINPPNDWSHSPPDHGHANRAEDPTLCLCWKTMIFLIVVCLHANFYTIWVP